MDLLKIEKPMMQGPHVKRLQELLDGLGNQFDTGDNDGIYGPKTEFAVQQFQAFARLTVDGIVGQQTWKALLEKTDVLRDDGQVIDGVLFDRRGMHKKPKLWERYRAPGDVIGVCLHQTSCSMPSKASGWDRLSAHVGITQEGKVILVNGFDSMIWHAQKLSARTIGIEIEGNFFGDESKPWSLWKPGGGPDHLNEKMMVALDTLYDYLEDWFGRFSKWKYIHAHRQSSKARRSDPGAEIWNAVAIPWMQRSGADDGGEGFYLWKGRPIPNSWDVRYNNSF
jgi:hypothetical protein